MNAEVLNAATSDRQFIVGKICDSAGEVTVPFDKEEPVTIKDGGTGTPFAQKDFDGVFNQFALQAQSTYKYYETKVNLLWADLSNPAGMIGVPWRMNAITEMAEDPMVFVDCRFKDTIHINVGVNSKQFKLQDHKGTLQLMSPPEVVFGYLQKCRKLLEHASEAELDGLIKKMSIALRDVSARFYACSDEDAWWFDYNMRDSFQASRKRMAQSLVGRLCGYIALRKKRIRDSGADAGSTIGMTQYYNAKTNVIKVDAAKYETEPDEAVSDQFMIEANTIIATMEEHPEVYVVLMDLDQELGMDSPLNTTLKLKLCISAAKGDRDTLIWVFQSIKDGALAGTSKVFTKATNQEFRAGTRGNGLPNVIAMKLALKEHMLRVAAARFSMQFVSQATLVFQNHQSFRTTYVDMQGNALGAPFLKHASPSERQFADFLARCCFLHESPYPEALRTCVRTTKSVEDVLAHGCFCEQWDVITSMRQAEEDAKLASVEAQRKQLQDLAKKDTDAVEGGGDGTGKGTEHGHEADGTPNPTSSKLDDEATAGDGDLNLYWQRYAAQTLRTHCYFVVAPTSGLALLEILKKNGFMTKKMKVGTEVCILHYDEKLASECATSPWERHAPHRSTYVTLCLKTIMDEYGLPPGYVVLYFDHGKKQITATSVQACFAAIGNNLHKVEYDIIYDEASFRERCRYKKNTFVEAKENLHAYSTDMNTIPVCGRAHYPGTNQGKTWGSLVLDQPDSILCVPHGDKKKIYGTIGLRPSGGPPAGDALTAPGNIDGSHITALTLVPLCWREFPRKYLSCLTTSFKAKDIMDFTMGQGNLAFSVVERKGHSDYIGFGHTEEHIRIVRQHLEQRILTAMADLNSPLYNPLYASYLAKKNRSTLNDTSGGTEGPPAGPPPGPPKPKGKAATKKKPRKRKTKKDANAQDDDNASSAPPSSTDDEDASGVDEPM